MHMIISFASVLLIENTRTKTGGDAAVRAAEQRGAPRSGRGGNRFSKKIGGHPRALRAASPAVMLGMSRRAPPTPAIMARPSGQRTAGPVLRLGLTAAGGQRDPGGPRTPTIATQIVRPGTPPSPGTTRHRLRRQPPRESIS